MRREGRKLSVCGMKLVIDLSPRVSRPDHTEPLNRPHLPANHHHTSPSPSCSAPLSRLTCVYRKSLWEVYKVDLWSQKRADQISAFHDRCTPPTSAHHPPQFPRSPAGRTRLALTPPVRGTSQLLGHAAPPAAGTHPWLVRGADVSKEGTRHRTTPRGTKRDHASADLAPLALPAGRAPA